jgi:hypothetical protein
MGNVSAAQEKKNKVGNQICIGRKNHKSSMEDSNDRPNLEDEAKKQK